VIGKGATNARQQRQRNQNGNDQTSQMPREDTVKKVKNIKTERENGRDTGARMKTDGKASETDGDEHQAPRGSVRGISKIKNNGKHESVCSNGESYPECLVDGTLSRATKGDVRPEPLANQIHIKVEKRAYDSARKCATASGQPRERGTAGDGQANGLNGE